MTVNYFCVRHENRRKYNEHFKLLFFKINLHVGTSDLMSTYGKLNLLPINSIFLFFSSKEIKGRLIQTKVYYKLFYSISKEASHKPLKVAAAKNISQVCLSLIQLASMNVFYYM